MSAPLLALTVDQITGIAEGYGDEAAIAVLNRGQLGKRIQLIRLVWQTAGETGRGAAVRPAADLLTRAGIAAPEAVDAVVGLPHVGSWAKLCMRHLAAGPEVPAGDVERTLGHLSSLAAAAGIGAGLDFDIAVPTLLGTAHIPGVGSATGLGEGWARAVRADGKIWFAGADGTVVDLDGPGWQPRRTVRLGDGYELAVEDQDPYRHCYQWLPLAYLSEGRAHDFKKLLTDAWHLIEREHPRHATGMRQSLRAVVPLAKPPSGLMISAASRHAGGSIGVSVPDTAEDLALLMVHEYMHAKLGALLDVCDLHTADGDGLFHAPWRLDPRPVGALLQGVYAHVGVTDFWRRRRLSPEADRSRAHAQFTYWLGMNRLAAAALAESGELTDLGQRFITILRNTLEAWWKEAVPADVEAGVRMFVVAQMVRWRLLNWAPDDAETDRLEAAVRAGTPTGAVMAAGAVRAGTRRGPVDAPGVLAHLCRWLGSDADDASPYGHDPDDAAATLLSGDPAGAAERYLARLDADCSDEDAWIGLAVSRLAERAAGAGQETGSGLLVVDRPDLCRAVVSKLQRCGSPEAATELDRRVRESLAE